MKILCIGLKMCVAKQLHALAEYCFHFSSWYSQSFSLLLLSFYPGRILNRFAKDIGLMDENLPPTIADFNQVRYLAT